MKRKLYARLLSWKKRTDRKPLILEGARQVGKTYILQEFGEKEFDEVFYVNFQDPQNAAFRGALASGMSTETILSELELRFGKRIIPGKALILFDEAQEAPEIITSLKYFYEKHPEHYVVIAGSLLGLYLHFGISFPVGKVDRLHLEPMDFEEFLWAKNLTRFANRQRKAPAENLHDDILLNAFREYLVIGGMPAVVRTWLENADIERATEIQRLILSDYRADIGKHTDEAMAVRIRQVFDTLPAQFAKGNDKFLYGTVRSGARAREYELAIEWLVDAGIMRRVFQVSRGDRLPLKAYAHRQSFKLYFIDVGLFRCLAGIPPATIIEKDALFDEFGGLLAEQYVLQELSDYELFYWTSQSGSEVDFVCQIGENIVPIEVKSGENVKAKSLRVYREKYQPELALRFSLKDLERNRGLLNIPLYYSFLFDALLGQ